MDNAKIQICVLLVVGVITASTCFSAAWKSTDAVFEVKLLTSHRYLQGFKTDLRPQGTSLALYDEFNSL